ncbi:MAG: YciI family protein [Pseudomonadota bacterium]
MRYMILRKADADTEAGAKASAALLEAMGSYMAPLVERGVMQAGFGLHPSAGGKRVSIAHGKAVSITDGPFTESKELVAGVSVYELPTREEALASLLPWPAVDGGGNVALELREAGCPGGCAAVASDAQGAGQRFCILLRSSALTEGDDVPPRAALDALDAFNAAQVNAGVLLAGEGLQSSARGARVKFSGGKPAILDGPFAETKELIAGYWMVRVAAIEDAIAFACRIPYPVGPHVEVEIRQVYEMDELVEDTATAADQLMRFEQLEAGMREQLAASRPTWQ